ncbi:hypothetical protein EXN66_Car021520 [Channa argus]|uniref:Uncharacterized protein n=1 Tax=Channa argus TaxID=215402 RepID=A0A6G1QU39_CHAAH|nr:hypothetical protein EXN66_Car021520 [Channa argus]
MSVCPCEFLVDHCINIICEQRAKRVRVEGTKEKPCSSKKANLGSSEFAEG